MATVGTCIGKDVVETEVSCSQSVTMAAIEVEASSGWELYQAIAAQIRAPCQMLQTREIGVLGITNGGILGIDSKREQNKKVYEGGGEGGQALIRNHRPASASLLQQAAKLRLSSTSVYDQDAHRHWQRLHPAKEAARARRERASWTDCVPCFDPALRRGPQSPRPGTRLSTTLHPLSHEAVGRQCCGSWKIADPLQSFRPAPPCDSFTNPSTS